MNTHGNVVFNSEAYRRWMYLTPDDVVLGVAPLFHITGLDRPPDRVAAGADAARARASASTRGPCST